MTRKLIDEILSNPYPGRGVGWLVTRDDGLTGFYFATGRSDESRARRLVVVGEDGLEIIPTEYARDPLRHYKSAVSTGPWLVVGNGDHVETVAERLAQGGQPADACVEITFEPDPPLCTPRITTIINRVDADVVHMSTAFKSASARPEGDVLTLSAKALRPGEGLLLTTYRSDATAFQAPPVPMSFGAEIGTRADLLEILWESLSPEYRVALAVYDPLTPMSCAQIRMTASM